MAIQYFLLIDGMNGGSLNTFAPGAFELESFDFSLSFLGAGGSDEANTTFDTLGLEFRLGTDQTRLMEALVTGQTLSSAQVLGVVGNGAVVYDLRLGQVHVRQLTDTDQDDHIALSYTELDLTTATLGFDGSISATQQFLWDLQTGAPGDGVQAPVVGAHQVGSWAPETYVMLIAGVDGGGTQTFAPGAFSLMGFQMDFEFSPDDLQETGGQGSLPGSPFPVSVQVWDAASMAQLAQMAATGTVISEVQIQGYHQQGSGNVAVLYDLVLENAWITELSDTNEVDHLTFEYQTLELTRMVQGLDGSIVDSTVFRWTPVDPQIDGVEPPSVPGLFVLGDGGDNLLAGAEGDDTLLGVDGRDRLIGAAGNDRLIGGDSAQDLRDNIFGGDGDDYAEGGYGNDLLRGDAGQDTLIGGFGADTVIGGQGDDILAGNGLADLLFGGDGDDFLNGGFGQDRANGGAGADRFFHLGAAGHGSDWVQDYDAAEGDVLVFGSAASADQFQVNFAPAAQAGDNEISEAFVIYRPTGQILWALVDGGAQTEINLSLNGAVFDLLA